MKSGEAAKGSFCLAISHDPFRDGRADPGQSLEVGGQGGVEIDAARHANGGRLGRARPGDHSAGVTSAVNPRCSTALPWRRPSAALATASGGGFDGTDLVIERGGRNRIVVGLIGPRACAEYRDSAQEQKGLSLSFGSHGGV